MEDEVKYIDSQYNRIKTVIGHGYRREIVSNTRLIAERALGRKLNSNEVVHHIDNNSLNDVNSNLLILSRADHFQLHLRQGDKVAWGGKGGGHLLRREVQGSDMAWCGKCKKYLLKSNFYKRAARWNGVCNYCKSCQSSYAKILWQKRREVK